MAKLNQTAAFVNRPVKIESHIPAWNNTPAQTQTLTLAVTEWGTSEAPPARTFLLVHGLTANRQWWVTIVEKMLAASSDPIRLIALDLRGRGDSDKPAEGPYHVAANAADLIGLLDALGLHTPINYVGHSLGAHIGTVFASRYPERLRRLVLVDGGSRLSEDAAQAVAPAVNRLGQVYPSYEDYVQSLKQAQIFPEWTEAVDQAYHYDTQPVAGGVSSKVSKAAIMEELTNLATYYSLAPSLYPQIKVPTVIARAPVPVGSLPTPFLLPEHLKAMTETIAGGARVVEVPGTNHYTILVKPSEEFIQALLNG